MMKSNIKRCWIIEFVSGDAYTCDGDISLNDVLLSLFADSFIDKDPFFDKLKKNLGKLRWRFDPLSLKTCVCDLDAINILLKDKIKSICLTDQCFLSDDCCVKCTYLKDNYATEQCDLNNKLNTKGAKIVSEIIDAYKQGTACVKYDDEK